jgi:sarcosine oxidase gamma subunit
VPELIAKSALEGRRVALAGVTLAEADPGPITSIAVYPGWGEGGGQGAEGLGLAMPSPNSFAEKKGARIVWTGRDQAFLIGVSLPELEGAALTDQTDGWAVLALSGAGAVDVLARLVPVDLRLGVLSGGQRAAHRAEPHERGDPADGGPFLRGDGLPVDGPDGLARDGNHNEYGRGTRL